MTTCLFLAKENDDENDEDKNQKFISKGVPSYSDSWLLRQHNQAQREYQVKTNSLAEYNAKLKEEQENIREWQEAFQRNGLADFTPPMSFGLNCLMVGADDAQVLKLPWEDEAQASITSLSSIPVLVDINVDQDGDDDDDSPMDITLVPADRNDPPVQPSSANGLSVAPKGGAAVYDCIVDEGLLASILMRSSSNKGNVQTMRDLLNEAAVETREHGIYVVKTYGSQQLNDENKELLKVLGKEAGFEWEFELDGISDDHEQVSVARRYNTGVMPRVGKLAKKKGFFQR